MSPATSRRASLFVQVRNALRADILSGHLPPEARLPSESELIARFGVSRITVRQALAELQANGLVRTVNGKGSFVTQPGRRQAHGPLVGVLEAMRMRGLRAQGRLVSFKHVPATRQLAIELGIERGTPLGALVVMRYGDGTPFVIGTTWLAPGPAATLAAQDLTDQDVTVAIELGLGLRMARTRVRVEATLATARLARQLAYQEGAALLRIRTTSYDYDDQPVTHSDTYCRADMMDYRVTLHS
jgi:GntR family transcriptional regulator